MVGEKRADSVAVLVVLAVAAGIALLTLLGGPEWIEFVIVLVLFIATLIGSYWFLFAPQRQPEERGEDVRE